MKVLLIVLVVINAKDGLVNAKDLLKQETLCLAKTTADGATLNNTIQNKTAYNKPLHNLELMNETTNERYLHTIEKDLLDRTWNEYERPCLRQLLRIITNVRNSTLWATWIWDSMQLPVGQLYGTRIHLGNYDQCMNLPWKDYPEFRTQYCLAEINLSEVDPEANNVDLLGSVQSYIRLKTKRGLRYNNMTWGLCAPVACKPESVTKFADAMFRSTHLGQMNTQYNISVNAANCQLAGEPEEVLLEEYIFLPLALFLIITTLICTCYASYNGTEKSTILDLAKAFNIKNNAHKMMKLEDKSVRSVLGIRTASNFLIVTGHLWLIKNVVGVSNAGETDKNFDDSNRCTIFNIDMIVDTFFMMSGLLFAKNVMQKNLGTFNPLVAIAKRYIRLMCSIILILLILPIVLLRGDPSPLVKYYLQNEVDTCRSNWWKTVLMIGNYGDSENMCYPILWSLACDFHMFVIGIVIYCIYRTSRSAGIKTYIICAVASVVIPIIHGYMDHSSAVVAFDFRTSDDYRKYPVGDPSYVRTHLRAGPYFVGLAIGYLMALFPPEKYRNAISKKSSVLAFFVFLSIFLPLNIISGIYHIREYGPLEGALFSVTRRNVFAALIGFLLIICEYGTLPFISSALSWSGLVPLSNMSYGVYLTHFMILFRYSMRTRVPLRSDAIDNLYATFGYMAITMSMSLLMWLFWEAPIVNLFDILVFKRSAGEKQQNGKVENNGTSDGKLNTSAKYVDSNEDKKMI